MSETTSSYEQPAVFESPFSFGAILGALLAVVERFIVPFELTTLGVAFFVIGVVLVWFSERSWVDVGRAVAVVGVVSVVALQVLTLVFG